MTRPRIEVALEDALEDALDLIEDLAGELGNHQNHAYCEMGVEGDVLDRAEAFLRRLRK
jgi:hypothetical protein